MASAAILVGGAGRRYGGHDKSTLIVEGRAILDRQLEVLTCLTDDILLIGRPPGDAPAGARAVPDRTPGLGPLGGLDTALSAARDEHLLLLACDMPFVSTELLRYLLSLAAEADVVVPRTDRGYHPLCAVYARACHGTVTRRLAQGELRMTALLGEVRVRAVDRQEMARVGDVDRLLANVNSPADFDRIATRLGHTR